MLNLPNFLTLVRILTIPVFLVMLSSDLYLEAFAVFVIGGLTDALDGAVARMTHQETALGTYLDPVADKLLVMSSFAVLGLTGAIPAWLAVLVIVRDVILLLGYVTIFFYFSERPEVQPSLVGKLNTLCQLVTIGTVLVLLYNPDFLPRYVLTALILATTATTVVSGFQYIYRGLVWLQNRAPTVGDLS
jgi:cardiolipin synthase